jgi:hypothetical protein
MKMRQEHPTPGLISARFLGLPATSWIFLVSPAIPSSATTNAMPDYPTAHDAQDISAISDIQR